MSVDVSCPPSTPLLAWLRHVRVRRLLLEHSTAAPRSSLTCLGFASSEQRYRASVSTLLATLDFVRNSAPYLIELSGVHPREGILHLAPFQALERVTMAGAANEVCKLAILEGLPKLREVLASGYGEYTTHGLPASVRRLDLQWAPAASSFAIVYFDLPADCQLDELALTAQRPLCMRAPCLQRCASLRVSARRVYLGLPLRRAAAWEDVDDLAARFAQFMLGSSLECVEATTTRLYIFQPVQESFDLGNNEGVGSMAQHEQLATVLLARHFQALHVEQRMLAVGAYRAYMRITRRKAEPMAFSFADAMNSEQLDFLQRHALATSITFGTLSGGDALAVLNSPAFADRNAGLLQQLHHLELSTQLNLAPYIALQNVQGTWHSEPAVPLGPARLSSLRLTPPLGAQPALRRFTSRWLAGVRHLANLALARFSSADLSALSVRPSHVSLSALQPAGGLLTRDTLQLPPGGFGPGCSLALRMSFAPPHVIQGGGPPPQAGLFPGGVAAALQQQAVAQQAAQQAAAVAAAAAAAAVAAAAQQQLGLVAPQQPPQQQAQQQQAAAGNAAQAAALAQAQQQVQWLAQDAHGGAGQQAGGAAPVLGEPVPVPLPLAGPQVGWAGPQAAALPALPAGNDVVVVDSDDEDADMPGLESDDEEDAPLAPQAGGGGAGLGAWVMVPAQQAQQAQLGLQQAAMQPAPVGLAQPWAVPDDRLADVTIRHDALFSAAGSVSVHAGALCIVYTGSSPDHLLQLLTGCSGGPEAPAAAAGPTTLRTLRLCARSIRFEAVPAKSANEDGQGEQEEGAERGAHAAPAARHTEQGQPAAAVHTCTGGELRDFILGSGWAGVWQAKLQRSTFRDQETLILTRQEPASPVPATRLAAAAIPATR